VKVYEPPINGEYGTTISPKDKMKFINDYYIGRSNIDALYSVVATNRKLHGKSNDKSNDKRSKR
jgi:hypothetical protein